MEDYKPLRKRKVEIEISGLEASTIAMATELYLRSVSRFMSPLRIRRYKSIIEEFRKIENQYQKHETKLLLLLL